MLLWKFDQNGKALLACAISLHLPLALIYPVEGNRPKSQSDSEIHNQMHKITCILAKRSSRFVSSRPELGRLRKIAHGEKNSAPPNKYTSYSAAEWNCFSFFSLNSTKTLNKMFPAGVIVVFVLVFLAFCAIVAIQIQKKLKARKANQRF